MRGIPLAILFFYLAACSGSVKEKKTVIPVLVLNKADTALHMQNGVWYYQGKPFSGYLHAFYPGGALQSTQSFYQGKEEGALHTFFLSGARETERYFAGGEKTGIHRGWWENGQPRFEYHFLNGAYEGDFREWYASGAPFKYVVYRHGADLEGMGWRENGKLFMNYVMKAGRRYGIMNAQPCYTLRNEKGEYMAVAGKKSPL